MFKPTHSFIPDCEKLRFVLDTETLALEETNAAVVDIALVEVLGSGRFFSGQIKPSWYKEFLLRYPDSFTINPATVEWHDKNNPDYISMLEQRGEAGATVIGRLFDFLVDLQTMEQKQVVIMTQGIDFDIPRIANLFKQCSCPLPWHYRNVRDLRTLQNLTPQLKYVAGNHTALEDARHSADHLMKQTNCSQEMFQYIFGTDVGIS